MQLSEDYENALAERFWSRVDKSGECWEWRGTRLRQGYGILSVAGKQTGAHRVAYGLTNGWDSLIPGRMVCHRCDNPGCVRPEHLFIGSGRTNAADARKKGRVPTGRNKDGGYKLTPDDVREIRRDATTNNGFARCMTKFNISGDTIYSILRGRTWRWVGDETAESASTTHVITIVINEQSRTAKVDMDGHTSEHHAGQIVVDFRHRKRVAIRPLRR